MLFSVWRILTYHTLRLSIVWPINFQYHSQAAATGLLAMLKWKRISQLRDSSNIQRSRKLCFLGVYGRGSLASNVSVSVS